MGNQEKRTGVAWRYSEHFLKQLDQVAEDYYRAQDAGRSYVFPNEAFRLTFLYLERLAEVSYDYDVACREGGGETYVFPNDLSESDIAELRELQKLVEKARSVWGSSRDGSLVPN